MWATGCATGEEAYFIGMCLLERVASRERNGKLQIFATDIDSHALEIARVGTYPDGMASSLAPECITRFFTKSDYSYRVKKELHEAMVFAPQNLITDTPFSRLDLIICRNLLIYLEPELQQKVIALFHFALNQNGYLFLDKSETVGRQLSLFEPLSKKWRIYRRSGPVRQVPADFPLIPEALPGERPGGPRPRPPRPGDHGEVIRALLLARYAPAAVWSAVTARPSISVARPTTTWCTRPGNRPTTSWPWPARARASSCAPPCTGNLDYRSPPTRQ